MKNAANRVLQYTTTEGLNACALAGTAPAFQSRRHAPRRERRRPLQPSLSSQFFDTTRPGGRGRSFLRRHMGPRTAWRGAGTSEAITVHLPEDAAWDLVALHYFNFSAAATVSVLAADSIAVTATLSARPRRSHD